MLRDLGVRVGGNQPFLGTILHICTHSRDGSQQIPSYEKNLNRILSSALCFRTDRRVCSGFVNLSPPPQRHGKPTTMGLKIGHPRFIIMFQSFEPETPLVSPIFRPISEKITKNIHSNPRRSQRCQDFMGVRLYFNGGVQGYHLSTGGWPLGHRIWGLVKAIDFFKMNIHDRQGKKV